MRRKYPSSLNTSQQEQQDYRLKYEQSIAKMKQLIDQINRQNDLILDLRDQQLHIQRDSSQVRKYRVL